MDNNNNNENMECQCSVMTFSRQCSANLLGRTLFQQRQLRDWFLIYSSYYVHFANADNFVFSTRDLYDMSKGPVSLLGLLIDNQVSNLDITRALILTSNLGWQIFSQPPYPDLIDNDLCLPPPFLTCKLLVCKNTTG